LYFRGAYTLKDRAQPSTGYDVTLLGPPFALSHEHIGD
jgi:hypothetical protein